MCLAIGKQRFRQGVEAPVANGITNYQRPMYLILNLASSVYGRVIDDQCVIYIRLARIANKLENLVQPSAGAIKAVF